MRAMLAGLVACALAHAASADDRPGRLALTVSETAGIRRFGYPVYARLGLPREVKARDRFRLLSGGKPVVAQFRVMTTAGEKKSVALDFNLSLGPLEKKAFVVEYGPGVSVGPEGKGGLTLEEAKGTYTVRTGGLAYVVDPAYRWLRSVRDGKKEYLRPGVELAEAVRPTVKVMREGPLAVCLRLHGKEGWDRGSYVDLTFPRSKSWVECVVSIDDPDGTATAQLFELPLLIQGKALVDFGAGTGVYTTLVKGQRAALSVDAAGAWKVSTGDKKGLSPFVVPAPGVKTPAEGWAHVMDAQRATAVAVDRFTQGGRASIEVSGEGGLQVWKHFAPGQKGRKTVRIWVHFVNMPVQVGALTSPQSMQSPLVVEVKPGK